MPVNAARLGRLLLAASMMQGFAGYGLPMSANAQSIETYDGDSDPVFAEPVGNEVDDETAMRDAITLSPRQQIRAARIAPGEPLAASNQRREAVQGGNPSADGADAFGQNGFRLGGFDGALSIRQSIGYSDNLSQSANGSSGGFSETSGSLSLTTDWSRHQLQNNVVFSYQKPFDDSAEDRPELLVDSALRLDLIDGMTLTTRGFYDLRTQSVTDSTLAPGAIDRPLQHSYGGSVSLERVDRKLQFEIRGSFERNIFADADLGGGVIQSQEDRNNNELRVAARVGYETSAAFTPFVEAEYGTREYDLSLDRNGNRRDSTILELRGGLEIDLGEKLTGEISVGQVTEQFDDPALGDLTGVTANGRLEWSPERDTQVGLTLSTETSDSITANSSGSVIYNGRLDVNRQLTSRTSATAFADIRLNNNITNETLTTFGVGMQYWVNRFVAVTADIEHSRFNSDDTSNSFDETRGQLGVRLER